MNETSKWSIIIWDRLTLSVTFNYFIFNIKQTMAWLKNYYSKISSYSNLPCPQTFLSHSIHSASVKAQLQAWLLKHFLLWQTQASQKSQTAPWNEWSDLRYILTYVDSLNNHKSLTPQLSIKWCDSIYLIWQYIQN